MKGFTELEHNLRTEFNTKLGNLENGLESKFNTQIKKIESMIMLCLKQLVWNIVCSKKGSKNRKGSIQNINHIRNKIQIPFGKGMVLFSTIVYLLKI